MAQRWSEDDIEYLHDNIGIKSYSQLSQKLGRKEGAIKLYRCRNGLPMVFDNIYTYTLLARELGKSRTMLRRYAKRGWLVGKKANWICKWGKHPMIFLDKNIVQFLKRYHHLFNVNKVPNPYFRNIIKDSHGNTIN